MGLVKFNNTTLNIAEIPDGHIVIPQSEYESFRGVQNSYLILQSKIPAGTDHAKLGELIDKGARFETLNSEIGNIKTQLSEANTKLQGFSNIPQGFTVEKWNAFELKDKQEIRAKRISELEQKVYSRVETEDKVKVKVDKRFLPDMSNLDLAANDIEQKMYDIYKQGYAEQTEFIKTNVGQQPTTQQQAPLNGQSYSPSGDVVNDGRMHVDGLRDLAK